MSAIEFFHPR